MATLNDIDLPGRVVQVARALFVARGYRGISMREIAEAVGASKAALYYHFGDKEALFLAVLTADLRDLGRLVMAASEAGRDTRERVRGIAVSILSLPPDRRAIIRLASQEMAQLSVEAQQAFYRLYRELFITPVTRVLIDGMAHGELKQANPTQLTWILLGMMYPFLYPAHSAELGDPLQVADLMVEVFFYGAGMR